MQQRFQSHIAQNRLFDKRHKLLLAISGGVDSVVLAHLLKQGGFNFSLAHCNFQLRGKDSEADQRFCEKLAKELNVTLHTRRFDVASYSKQHKQSTQMAARNLRYSWFSELMEAEGTDHLLTAHHAGDLVETVLINLLRGTGIKGLKGIPEKNGNIVRPLLGFTKEEIAAYAEQHNIKFRLDKSNLQDKYERNFLRLNIIPKLKELNPNLERTFLENSFRFAQEEAIVNAVLEKKIRHLKREQAECTYIDKIKLKKEKQAESLLHALLAPYGFNATQQQNILKHLHKKGLTGKRFYAPDHELAITATELVIQPVTNKNAEPVLIHSLKELKQQTLFKIEPLTKFVMPGKRELIVNKDQLIFPLTIRPRQTGDKLRPFGMKGFKLVSDLMKEEKLNAFEKETCPLLVNGNGEIIWVAGYRSDDRYKVNKTDASLLKLTLIG